MSTASEVAMLGIICLIFGVLLLAKFFRWQREHDGPWTLDQINCGIGMAASAGTVGVILLIIAGLP